MTKNGKRYQWLTFFLALAGLSIHWWKIILNIHLYLLGSKDVGIESYFSTIYYSLYDKNSILTGFNFPYGEHLAYTDGQPIFSYLFSFLLNGNYDYVGNIVTILNLLILFSIPLGAVYLFRLFSLWKMPNGLSVVLSIAIVLLSPQIMRTIDLPTLSYVCFFPAIWFYAASWLQDKKISALVALNLFLLFFTFVNVYYLAIELVFLISTAFFYFLYKIRKPYLRNRAFLIVISAFIPLVAYYIWLHTTGAQGLGGIYFRSESFFTSHITFRDLFIPMDGFLKNVISLLIPIGKSNMNNYAYVGFASILSILMGIWVLRNRILENEVLAHGLGVFLLASLICLIIASGIPFTFFPHNLVPKEILQLGTLSRFAEPFYYVFAVTGAWFLYILSEYLRKKSQSVLATSILFTICAWWLYEGIGLQKRQADIIKRNGKEVSNFLSFNDNYYDLLTSIGQDPKKFQAIMAFPYFNTGSGDFQIMRNEDVIYQATKASLNLNLPIAQNLSGRLPLAENIHSIQLLSNPLIKKEILKDIPDDRSFLLLTVGQHFEEDEMRIIQKSRLLTKEGNLSFYDLPLSAFKNVVPNGDSLKFRYGIKKLNNAQLSTSHYQSIQWQDFKGQVIKNNQAFKPYTISPNNSSPIEVSIWFQIENRQGEFPNLFADVIDTRNEVIQRYTGISTNSTNVKDHKIRASLTIPPNLNYKTLKIGLDNLGKQAVSTLLIRPSNQDVWVKEIDGQTYYNNFPL